MAVPDSESAGKQVSITEGTTETTIESRKVRNRHSLPALPIDHSRAVSTSSNETLVWSQSGSSSPSSPASSFGRALQDTATRIISEKQADKVHWLEEECECLRTQLAHQTDRATELEANFKLCEQNRQDNLNTALRLYGSAGKSVLIETQNMLAQIGQLRLELQERDSQIWSRDQMIDALRFERDRFASQEHWALMWQTFYALQEEYGQMPQDFNNLERKYEDLEDEHVDVLNRLKTLEGQYTEVHAQLDQIGDERDRLENDVQTSKQSLAQAEARLWALEVQRDQIQEPKTKSKKNGFDPVKTANQIGKTRVNGDENDCSSSAANGWGALSESPNTFNARRRQEVAAAEEKLLGPLGLGFADGSPTLKTKPLADSTNTPKKSKFMQFFTESTTNPSKTGESPVLKPETSAGYSGFKSVPTPPLQKEGPIFQGLGANGSIKEEAKVIPSLAKENFQAPRSLDFNFGNSDEFPFVAAQAAPSTSKPKMASSSSKPHSALDQNTPSTNTNDHEIPEKTLPTPTIPPKKHKRQKSPPKEPQEPKNEGPNRKQRRAAIQTRKEEEKKVQLAKEKARKLKAKGKGGKAKGVNVVGL